MVAWPWRINRRTFCVQTERGCRTYQQPRLAPELWPSSCGGGGPKGRRNDHPRNGERSESSATWSPFRSNPSARCEWLRWSAPSLAWSLDGWGTALCSLSILTGTLSLPGSGQKWSRWGRFWYKSFCCQMAKGDGDNFRKNWDMWVFMQVWCRFLDAD